MLKLLPDFFGLTQAFLLLHVVRRQGGNIRKLGLFQKNPEEVFIIILNNKRNPEVHY